MKISFTTKIIIILLTGIIGLSLTITGQTTQDAGNKQYVEITLKNGEKVMLEYRHFMEANFRILAPVMIPKALEEAGEIPFGINRIELNDDNNCEKVSIGLDNFKEMQMLGPKSGKCTGEMNWMVKIKLLDLRTYEGYFSKRESQLEKPLPQHGVSGQLLNTSEMQTFSFKDIRGIAFNAR